MSDSLGPFAESKRELIRFNSDNLPAFVWGFTGNRQGYMRGVLWAMNQQRLGDDWFNANNELTKLSKLITGMDDFNEAMAAIIMAGEVPKDTFALQIQSQFFQTIKDEPHYSVSLNTYIKTRKALNWLMMNIRIKYGEIDDAFALGQMSAAKWALNQRCSKAGYEVVKEGYLDVMRKNRLVDVGKFLDLSHGYKFKKWEAKAICHGVESNDRKFLMGVLNAIGVYYLGEDYPMEFEKYYYDDGSLYEDYCDRFNERKKIFEASRKNLIVIIDALFDKALSEYPEMLPSN